RLSPSSISPTLSRRVKGVRPRYKSSPGSDPLPRAAGAVDGVDELERLIALLAGDQRRAPGPDRLREIVELPLERIERNRHRVGRPRCHIARHRSDLARIVLNVPPGQPIPCDDRRAFCAVNLAPLR